MADAPIRAGSAPRAGPATAADADADQRQRTELGGEPEPAVPRGAQKVIELIGDLQYPFHAGSV